MQMQPSRFHQDTTFRIGCPEAFVIIVGFSNDKKINRWITACNSDNLRILDQKRSISVQIRQFRVMAMASWICPPKAKKISIQWNLKNVGICHVKNLFDLMDNFRLNC
jgi:hypothetical protein